MLSLQGVSVRYGTTDSVPAVDGVNLTVPDGRVLALLGPSGCGKSTLLRAIAGLEPVSAGEISWNGQDLVQIPVHRRGFGLMFQDGVLFPHRSVAGNVGYGLRRSGLSAADIRSRVEDLLDLVGLPGYQERSVSTLSGGEAQRVALARALAPRPRLLLLDEPLAALDRALRERLLADLRLVLEITSTTALFVTHDQTEAFAVADELAVMRAGRILQTGAPRQVWSAPRDEWVARFVGYQTVLTGPIAEQVWGTTTAARRGIAAAEALALRPAALVVDPLGPLTGTVRSVSPRPEGQALQVALDNLTDGARAGHVDAAGPVAAAVGPADVAVSPGDTVRLVFRPEHAAVLPAAGLAASSLQTSESPVDPVRSGTIDP